MPLILDGTTGIVANNIADYAISTAKLANSAVTVAKMGYAGAVLQVAQTVKTDTWSSTASSWADVTGLSATITPTSASSKIMVIVDMAFSMSDINNLNASWKILRNSTDIGIGAGGTYNVTGGFNMYLSAGNIPMVLGNSKHYLDSPSTTSATTYKIQMQKADASGTMYVNRRGNSDTEYRAISVVTLMEIAQ